MALKDEILDSGVIEAHVLAVSSEEDVPTIHTAMGLYPELEMVLEENQLVLENLAVHQEVDLPEDFKIKIKNQLDFKVAPTDVAEVSEGFFSWKNVAIAASVAALISFGTTAYMTQKANSAETALQLAQQQKELLVSETNFIRDQKFEISNQLSFVLGNNKSKVDLKGQPFSPQAAATVYWDGKEVYLHANQIPPNEIGTQYQLWAIVDGKPVDAGVFDVNESIQGLIKLKTIEKASAFAVTLEQRGGSKVPTLEKMLVLGNVTI